MLPGAKVLKPLNSAGSGDLTMTTMERRRTGILVHARAVGRPSLLDAVVGSPFDGDGSGVRKDRKRP